MERLRPTFGCNWIRLSFGYRFQQLELRVHNHIAVSLYFFYVSLKGVEHPTVSLRFD